MIILLFYSYEHNYFYETNIFGVIKFNLYHAKNTKLHTQTKVARGMGTPTGPADDNDFYCTGSLVRYVV